MGSPQLWAGKGTSGWWLVGEQGPGTHDGGGNAKERESTSETLRRGGAAKAGRGRIYGTWGAGPATVDCTGG